MNVPTMILTGATDRRHLDASQEPRHASKKPRQKSSGFQFTVIAGDRSCQAGGPPHGTRAHAVLVPEDVRATRHRGCLLLPGRPPASPAAPGPVAPAAGVDGH